MKDLAASNNQIIETWTPEFLLRVNEAERAKGIKHHRKYDEPLHHAKFGKQQDEIRKISFNLTKGLIMTNKGKGKYPENRVAKPAWNEVADVLVPELADKIAVNSLDVISHNFSIR